MGACKKVDSRFVTMDCRAAKTARNDKGDEKRSN